MGFTRFYQQDAKDAGGDIKMKKNDHIQIAKCIRNPEALKLIYDKVLERWPVAMEKVYIPTSLGKTLCIESGDKSKQPMILIHGSMSNSASWMADIKKLNEKHHTYCLDIPGDPGGSEDRRFSWNGPYFSRWIRECMNFLNIDKSVVGGLSLGGWASLRFAIDHPESVSKLFLLAPAGVGPINVLSVIKLVIFSSMGKWGQNKILRMLFQGKEITQDLRDFFKLTTGNCMPRRGNPPIFSDEELSSIKASVIFIGGKNDLLVDTNKTQERLRKNISNLKSLILKDGHALIQLEDEVFDLLT